MSQQASFGELLKRYRTAAGLTQEVLAEQARLSTRGISDLERGARQTPRRDTVQLLADALGLAAPDRVALEAAARRSATPSLPFVGRAPELALLEQHLAGHGPPVLLLAGEPGIGKTRLLHAAIPRAVGAGWRVLMGGCQRRGGQGSYEPLTAALAQHLHRAVTPQARAHLRGCAWLVRLLPEVAEMGVEALPSWTVEPDQERRLLFLAVQRFLTNVAGPAGSLLVLDDLQWAGPDALDLLAALARAEQDVPVRIIGAYRDTEVQARDPLAITLSDLTHAELAARRLLRPLALAEAARLLDELLEENDTGPALREQVLQRTGGVPFFLVSCARGLRQDEEDEARKAVPWNVAQSVHQRVAALPDAARQILGIAAVIGRTAPHGLLRIVAARPEQEVLAALDAACHAHLLVEESETAYRFTHDVIREVVEADLGTARRMLLHRDIALVLEAQSEPLPVVELAYHHARGDQPERALPYLETAAERAWMAAAHQEAASLLAQAIELAQRVGRDDLLGDLHARRGKALSDMTRWAEARLEMQAALERVPPERLEQRAEILVDVAMASHWLSDSAGTRRYASEALAVAERHGHEELAIAALSALVVADCSDGALRAGVARYGQAAARAGDRYSVYLAHGVEHIAMALYWLADLDEAVLRAREAVTVGRAAHDSSVVARALGDLGCTLMGSGQYGAALQAFTEAQQFSRELGAINWLARSTAMRGGLHLELFDYDTAEALAEEARALSRSAQHFIHCEASAGIDLLLNFTRRGEVGRTERLVGEVAESVAHGQGAHGWLWGLRFAQAQAEMALARGEYAHALQGAEEVIARSRTLGRVKYEVAGLQVRAQTLAARGHPREAIVDLQFAVKRARRTGDPAMFLGAAAALLLLDGNDALLAEARSGVERIVGALPDAEMRRRLQEAEPVRMIVRLATP